MNIYDKAKSLVETHIGKFSDKKLKQVYSYGLHDVDEIHYQLCLYFDVYFFDRVTFETKEGQQIYENISGIVCSHVISEIDIDGFIEEEIKDRFSE